MEPVRQAMKLAAWTAWWYALGSFVRWYRHPQRCGMWFDLFWEPTAAFKIAWCGWFQVVHETGRGWRGWSIHLHTD